MPGYLEEMNMTIMTFSAIATIVDESLVHVMAPLPIMVVLPEMVRSIVGICTAKIYN